MILRTASLFSQLLQEFPRDKFQALVKFHKADKGSKGFSTWEQFVAMLFCQMAQAKSLREVEGGLACCLGKLAHLGLKTAPPRSTLSYANAHRPPQFFEDLFYQTLDRVQAYAPKKKLRFKNKLMSLDSTVISLCLSLYDWAKYRRAKGAAKVHLVLDHDGYLPCFALITDGKKADVSVAQNLVFPAETVVAFDRGYNDYALFGVWTGERVWFVTRMKEGTAYEVVERREVPKNRNILSDEVIRLAGKDAEKKCPHRLRRVVVWDKENEREIVLLSNHLKFGATTIADIYKERWQIELFFKAIKQNLKIKTFVGTSENAVRIQIWTALIAMLLLKLMQFRSRWGWSLSNLVALLRWNLFTYRDLWAWLDDPFDTPPLNPESMQLALPIQGLGQPI